MTGEQTESEDHLEPWDVRGDRQWVLRRSFGRRSTALLYLHGGPGSTLMPFSHAFDAHLLEAFDVVHWDQRGSGKSFDPKATADRLTLIDFAEDLRMVSARLRADGGYERILCVGHSWGSLLGLETAARFPDAMDAFVGVGQVVDDAAAQMLGKIHCAKVAATLGDDRLAQSVAAFDALPVLGERRLALSALVAECGGLFGTLDPESLGHAFMSSPFTHPAEDETQAASVARLVEALWPSVLAFDFLGTLARVRCAVLCHQGERDRATPASLLTDALSSLPGKMRPQCDLLPGQGHFPFWEDPAGFARWVAAFAAT